MTSICTEYDGAGDKQWVEESAVRRVKDMLRKAHKDFIDTHPEDAPGGPKCVRESELDVAGAQFGIAFVDRGPNDHHQIAELYSEDDTSWGFVHDFSHLWLGDLRQVCDDALDRLKGETK